jgi:hypothetical protein
MTKPNFTFAYCLSVWYSYNSFTHSARCIPRLQVFWMTTRSLLPMNRCTRHPCRPPTHRRLRRSAVGSSGSSAGCAGDTARQQQQLWPGNEHNHSRAHRRSRRSACELSGARSRCSFQRRTGAANVRPQRQAAEGLQSLGEGTGQNTASTVVPTDVGDESIGVRRARTRTDHRHRPASLSELSSW